MSSTASSIAPRSLALDPAGDHGLEAPLRAAAGIGLAVLLSVPLWSGVIFAVWTWLE